VHVHPPLLFTPSPSPLHAALPFPRLREAPRTAFSKVGERARINCTETPGNLIRQYSITWRNSSSDDILASVPFNGNADGVNTRYSVDQESFALMIENVTFRDSIGSYQCELRVQNIQDSGIFSYGRSEDLELLVYGELRNHLRMCQLSGEPPQKVIISFLP
jgi:hypothetical protein